MSIQRVVHIIPNLKMGGAERLCLDIVKQLNNSGIKVLLILLENKVEYDFDPEGIDLYITKARAQLNPFKGASVDFLQLKERIENFSPDVVHTHLFEAELLWKSTQLIIPSFFHIHDNIKVFEPFIEGWKHKKSWLNFIEKLFYKKWLKSQSTQFLCISNDTKKYIERVTEKSNKDVLMLHNAIDYHRFYFNQERDLSEINLITIGSLVKKKGHAFLIEVIAELKKCTDKRVELLVLGDGPEKGNLLDLIKEGSLQNEIMLAGKVKRPETYLSRANLYIHGAYEEPFGLVLLEAMAAGLPVFTTDGGGNRDLIIQGENGRLYTERDPKEIANDINELFGDTAKYNRLSKGAINFARGFDIKSYTEDLIKKYESAIG